MPRSPNCPGPRDAFQNGALTRRKLIEWQSVVVNLVCILRFRKEASHLGNQLLPNRLIRQRHVVVGIELNEAAIGNKAREQSSFRDRYINVAFGVHDQYRTFDLARGFLHVAVTGHLKQPNGGVRRGRGAHLSRSADDPASRPAETALPIIGERRGPPVPSLRG